MTSGKCVAMIGWFNWEDGIVWECLGCRRRFRNKIEIGMETEFCPGCGLFIGEYGPIVYIDHPMIPRECD